MAISLGKCLLRIYLMLLLVAFFGQRCMMYPAPKTAKMPRTTRGKLVVIEGASHRLVHAYHIPAQDHKPTVVIFHGNAEQLADQLPLAEEFADLGLGAFAIEYPGYGLSSASTTTEEHTYSDAETALRYLETKLNVPRAKVVLFGRSLGTGVAAEMATRGFGNRIILVSPYTSMVELAAKIAPIVPTRWLIWDWYDTLAKTPNIPQPTLVVHGTKDNVIPCYMGKAVAARLRNATLQIVPDAGHNDLFDVGGQALWDIVVDFSGSGVD